LRPGSLAAGARQCGDSLANAAQLADRLALDRLKRPIDGAEEERAPQSNPFETLAQDPLLKRFQVHSRIGGKPLTGRFQIKELPPSSYSFQWDSATDGSTWSTVMEGKATKVK